MHALRKSDTEAQPAGPAQDGGATSTTVADHGPWPTGGEPAVSPALLLRDHLAARLDEMAMLGAGDAATLAEPAIAKPPVQLRVVLIVGMSLALWLGLYSAAVAIL